MAQEAGNGQNAKGGILQRKRPSLRR